MARRKVGLALGGGGARGLANIVIRPRVAHIGFGDLHRVQECILQGELAAQETIPEIKRRLPIRKAT